jgi:hypothetical protein
MAHGGRLRSGLCAERDDLGREFHFEVSAIGGPAGQYLVFERPAAAEQLQAVLQRAREQALRHDTFAREDAKLRAIGTTLELQVQEARRLARLVAARTPDAAVTGTASPPPTIDQEPAAERLLSVLDAIAETSRLVTRTVER